MRIASAPFMHRHPGLATLPAKVRDPDCDRIAPSARGDFLEWLKAPRAFPDRIRACNDEAGRQAAVTACALAPEDRGDPSSAFLRREMRRHIDQFCTKGA